MLLAVVFIVEMSLTKMTAEREFLSEQIYWARNLIFVFVDGGVLGMKAFLAAYHGESAPLFNYDRVTRHGGAIIGGFIIKTTGNSFNTLNIEYNMINGQLPNLDVVNLFVRLADKFDLTSTIYDNKRQSSWRDIAETVSKGILTQVIFQNPSSTSLSVTFLKECRNCYKFFVFSTSKKILAKGL